MRPSSWRDWTHRFSWWAGVIVLVLLAAWFVRAVLCGFGLPCQLDHRVWWPSLVAAEGFVERNQAWLLPSLVFFVQGCRLTCHWVGEPTFWQDLQSVIDDFQRDIFEGLPREAIQDDHRVTLYKHLRWCLWPGNRWCFLWPWGRGLFPWSGWLVPVVRSGTTREARTVFLAKSAQDSEGVVGHVFFSQSGTRQIKNLPDVDTNCCKLKVCDYARDTHVQPKWIRDRLERGRPLARSFLAIRIEVEDNRRWGVLMIDSRQATLPAPQNTLQQFKATARILKTLLRRA